VAAVPSAMHSATAHDGVRADAIAFVRRHRL